MQDQTAYQFGPCRLDVVEQPLTFVDSFNLSAVWSAEGNQIAFASARRSGARLGCRRRRWHASGALVHGHERHVRSGLGARVSDSLSRRDRMSG
jgi:hypothetical protein